MYHGIKQKWFTRDVVKVLITGMLIALIIQGLFASTLSHVIEAKIDQDELTLFGFVIGASALSGVIKHSGGDGNHFSHRERANGLIVL